MTKTAVLAAAIVLLSCGDDGEQRSSVQKRQSEYSWEYKLASIDAGGFIEENDIMVARFRSLLHQLSNKDDSNLQYISDASVRAINLLKGKGVEESLLNLMEGISSIRDRDLEGKDYDGYCAAYIHLRARGLSHPRAVAGINSILARQQGLLNTQ